MWASKARVGEREGDQSRTESKPKTLRTLRILCVESKTCSSRLESKGKVVKSAPLCEAVVWCACGVTGDAGLAAATELQGKSEAAG